MIHHFLIRAHFVLLIVVFCTSISGCNNSTITVRGVLHHVENPEGRYQTFIFEDGTEIEVFNYNWPLYIGQSIEIEYSRASQRIINVRPVTYPADESKAECNPEQRE